MAPPSRRVRALLVEDDPSFRRAAEALLRQIGVHDVDVAEDGRTAVQSIATATVPFDFVLCDLNLPIDDGIVVLRRLAGCADSPPLVLMSGEDSVTLQAAGRLGTQYGLHILGTLEKPFSIAQLQRILSRLHQPAPARSGGESPPLDVAEIDTALSEARFDVWFEPQMSLQTGAAVGLEALVRLCHSTEGLVMPARFIRQAEIHGQIGALTMLVVERVAEQCRAWRDAGWALPVSVNLSAAVLHDPAFVDAIEEICSRHRIAASAITFELTESAIADNPIALLDILTRLRLKGFGLALDDFGMGYAWLRQLHGLPFRQLKIDQWFVQAATRDDRSCRIVEYSLRLASQFGMSTVAEGVDSAASMDLMTSLGCDAAQGHFIARPMSSRDAARWLDEHHSAS